MNSNWNGEMPGIAWNSKSSVERGSKGRNDRLVLSEKILALETRELCRLVWQVEVGKEIHANQSGARGGTRTHTTLRSKDFKFDQMAPVEPS